MLRLLKRIFGPAQKTVATRLSEEQALEIARKTKIGKSCKDLLRLVKAEERDGTVIWVVSSATVGSMVEVLIDDKSGKVIKAERLGVR